MTTEKKVEKELIQPKMISIRKDQYERLAKIASKEERSMRSVLERMLDKYEGK